MSFADPYGTCQLFTSIHSIEFSNKSHRIYPNPVINQINLAFEVKPNEQFSFLLYNLQGTLIQEQSLNVDSKHSIPIKDRKEGLYLYQN